MTIQLSEKEQTFYDTSWDYPTLPSDLVPVTSDQHNFLYEKLNKGYYLKKDLTISSKPKPNEFAIYNKETDSWEYNKCSKESIEEAKNDKLMVINGNKNNAINSNIIFKGFEFQADNKSLGSIKNAIDTELDSFNWIDFNNVPRKLSLADLKVLYKKIVQRNSTIIEKAAKDKKYINSLNQLKLICDFNPSYQLIINQYNKD